MTIRDKRSEAAKASLEMRLKLLGICVGLLCGGAAQAGSTAIYEFSDRYEVLFYKGCPESQAWRCGLFAMGCRKSMHTEA